MVSETSSVRDSVNSFKEWEDYNSALQDVLNWLSQAERTLESQENISDDVDAVKKQFHGHEVNKYLYLYFSFNATQTYSQIIERFSI